MSEWITSEFAEARELSALELVGSPVANAATGWNIRLDRNTSLNLILDRDFPYSEPRVVIEGSPELLASPHLESRGKVCIAGDGGRVDSLNPVDVVAYVYAQAIELLSSNQAKENDADFQHDFRAYWRREENDEPPLYSMIDLIAPSRLLVSLSGRRTFVGDKAEPLIQLLSNLGVATNSSPKPAFGIWMEHLPPPIEYPSCVSELRQLVARRSNDGLQILDEVLSNPDLPVVGILMGPTDGRRPAGIGGFRIEARPVQYRPGARVQDELSKGFRRGKVPTPILASRLQLKRVHVEEVDGAKSRRPAHLPASILSAKKAMLIGCGSLGSGVARLLLQSRIGELTLIDPETFEWTNVERHELGASSVGRNKAQALEFEFRHKFPTTKISSYEHKWLDVYRNNKDVFESQDIIITTCAHWNAESALSDLQQSGELKIPVLYGWIEEAALAAHALALAPSSPCLRCGFEATGAPILPIVRAPKGVTQGCGDGVSLYGAIDMAPAQAMISGVALDVLLGRAKAPVHRVYTCPHPNLHAGDADWNADWISRHSMPPFGGTIMACDWPIKSGCSCQH